MDELAAFANFGFPESHAVSFAYLVYSSAWLKMHYPAAFAAGLLNAQPMGFWSPQALVADADVTGSRCGAPMSTVGGGAGSEWGPTSRGGMAAPESVGRPAARAGSVRTIGSPGTATRG